MNDDTFNDKKLFVRENDAVANDKTDGKRKSLI